MSTRFRRSSVKAIKAKERGEAVPVAEPEQPEEPVDLMTALRESVESAKRERGARKRPRSAKRQAAV